MDGAKYREILDKKKRLYILVLTHAHANTQYLLSIINWTRSVIS